MNDPRLPVRVADIRDLAQVMIDNHGEDAMEQIERMATDATERGDLIGAALWKRLGRAVREVRAIMPTGKSN